VTRPTTGDTVDVCVLNPIDGLTPGRYLDAVIDWTDETGFTSHMVATKTANAWRYWRDEGETWRRKAAP
jgi:hypothetical protein